MPDQTPSSAPDSIGRDARDDAKAATAMRDTGTATPGGGGLGGADAAGPLADTARGAGAAAPNSPIDAAVPADDLATDRKAEMEARTQAARDRGPEPHASLR